MAQEINHQKLGSYELQYITKAVVQISKREPQIMPQEIKPTRTRNQRRNQGTVRHCIMCTDNLKTENLRYHTRNQSIQNQRQHDKEIWMSASVRLCVEEQVSDKTGRHDRRSDPSEVPTRTVPPVFQDQAEQSGLQRGAWRGRVRFGVTLKKRLKTLMSLFWCSKFQEA